MSDAFYRLIVFTCRPVFTLSSSPIVLHAERVPREGGVIIAPTHFSPFDVPCLMATTPRRLDFVSIVEVFRRPVVGWFYGKMNAFPLDRSRVDAATTRTILRRLEAGRAVVVFAEGRLREPGESVLAGGKFKESVLRIAEVARVPIVPCVVLGTGAYARAGAWLPLRRTRYAVSFGEAVGTADELRRSWLALHRELREHPRFAGSAAQIVSDAVERRVQQCGDGPPARHTDGDSDGGIHPVREEGLLRDQ